MNIRLGRVAACCVIAGMLLSGCSAGEAPQREASEPSPIPSGSGPEAQSREEGTDVDREAPAEEEFRYIDAVVEETVARFLQPDMSEFEIAKAAFDYLTDHANLVDPIGLDLWRIRGSYREPPSFVENRSLSVLVFGVGKCEDYAAALTLLLRGAGLEAEYVPGLTYSTQGELVDHAWTVAKIDGEWYHLDCQLEQNISRHGSMRYKYFMRGDATFAGSHRWGQNLIDSGLLTAEQNEELARDFLVPACPRDYETPERRSFEKAAMPDVDALEAEIAAEREAYEQLCGPLEPLELNIIPPVFALEGFGPQE